MRQPTYHMITHPGARTRALYKWEHEEIDLRCNNKPINDLNEAVLIAYGIWKSYWNVQRPIPVISINHKNGGSECNGYSHIRLATNNHLTSTLLHELTHARGYGTPTNFHTVGFVKCYINVLSFYFKWNSFDLLMGTYKRGLI